ncbi:MAG TPA: sugar phosphate nucleotidyltransferase, partial [Oscillospiraceae bacterium]|nr:sugar phosphate nucleotidyltransferase [Oscillospiraceae bacterium]
MKKSCVAMLLAGGQGSRLYALTSRVAKPAVPFGGKYRIIDFPLSNCINSGIDTVGVLTQYQPLELNAYIGNGQPWDLDRADGGVHILPPYVREGQAGTWYKGTANAIYQNMGFLSLYDPEDVLILSGDHIYKMDYAAMLRRHRQSGAACTISVIEVPMAEAGRFGIMNVDKDDVICDFEEKPAQPKSNLASMGIYIFRWEKLRAYLLADEADPNSMNDFGKDVIPAMLRAGERMCA